MARSRRRSSNSAMTANEISPAAIAPDIAIPSRTLSVRVRAQMRNGAREPRGFHRTAKPQRGQTATHIANARA